VEIRNYLRDQAGSRSLVFRPQHRLREGQSESTWGERELKNREFTTKR
jgi:hypothetical protein